MKEIILKVIDGSEDLVGTTLRLTKIDEGSSYICKLTGFEIIDKWDELQKIKKVSNKNMKIKFDVLLFVDSHKTELSFISKVQRTSLKKSKLRKRLFHSVLKLVSSKSERYALGI